MIIDKVMVLGFVTVSFVLLLIHAVHIADINQLESVCMNDNIVNLWQMHKQQDNQGKSLEQVEVKTILCQQLCG